jgi:hypothetical protein
MAGAQDLLLEAVAEIRAKVNDMHAAHAVVEHRLDTLHDETQKISRTIHGDSEPERGMFPRLLQVERDVSDMRAERKAVSGWAWSAAGTAIIGAIAAWWKGSA